MLWETLAKMAIQPMTLDIGTHGRGRILKETLYASPIPLCFLIEGSRIASEILVSAKGSHGKLFRRAGITFEMFTQLRFLLRIFALASIQAMVHSEPPFCSD